MTVGEEHLTGKLEVLPLVRVRDEQCLGGTVVLQERAARSKE